MKSGCDCQKIAALVWSAVRVVLANAPTDLTSLRSLAYASLVSAFGPLVRSIAAFGTRNGVTFPTHGVGSGTVSGGETRQTPGVVPKTNGKGVVGLRPSFARAASIAAAAISPALIPPVFAAPFGIAPSAASYWAASVASAAVCEDGTTARSTR